MDSKTEMKKMVSLLKENSTPEEKAFALKLQRSGVKYKFQHPVTYGKRYFIVDFYIPETNTCVELDGFYHFTRDGVVKDKWRDSVLRRLGYKVVHINNKCVSFFDLSTISNIELKSKRTKAERQKQELEETAYHLYIREMKREQNRDKERIVNERKEKEKKEQEKRLKMAMLQYPYLFK